MFYETTILGQTPVKVVELVGTATPIAVEVKEEKVVDEKEAQLAELTALLAQYEKLTKVPAVEPQVAATQVAGKNKRAVKASATRVYVRVADVLSKWGRVPQQQLDLAAILMGLEKGKEYSEVEVFAKVEAEAGKYPQLAKSVQHPTYLFAYYRGLKNDGKHGGFVARNFLRVIG